MNIIMFEVNQVICAFPTERVLQVLEPVPVTELPFVPSTVDGLIHVLGKVIPQINLRKRLEQTDFQSWEEGQLLVVMVNQSQYALHIDHVLGMKSIEEENIHLIETKEKTEDEAENESSEEESKLEKSSLVKGEIITDGKTIFLLDIEKMGLEGVEAIAIPGTQGGLLGSDEIETTFTSRSSSRSSFSCLVMQDGGEYYAFSLSQVREIVEIDTITPLVRAPKEVAGIVSLREEPLLLFNLYGLLDQPVVEEARPIMVIVEYQEARIGILVHRIVGIKEFPLESLHHIDDVHRELEGYLLGDDGEMIGYLKLDGLIPPDRFDQYRAFLPRHSSEEEHFHEKIERFLMFSVGNEKCALPMEMVDQVVEYTQEDAIPEEGSGGLSGAIQIHGEIMPVVDLREQMNMDQEVTSFTAYVVVRFEEELWALVVDKVHRVIEVAETKIEPVTQRKNDYIVAIASLDGMLFSVLTLEPLHLLTAEV